MRVLVVSPHFPPQADSESFVGGKFVQALLDSGIDTVAISMSRTTHPAYPSDPSPRWHSLSAITIDVPASQRRPLLTRCRLGFRYQTIEWASWTAAVVTTARELHRRYPFDLVVSRSSPWHAHLAGYWVASTLDIPWLANLNDPWDL